MLARMQQASTPRPRRQISIVAILIVAMATPTTLALSYYHITGDPNFRPLAITVERLVARGETVEVIDVQAVVTTDGSNAGLRQGEYLREKLDHALYGKGLTAHISVYPSPETGPPKIFFYVDGHRIGPFTQANAAHGVRIAAESVTISRRSKGLPTGRSR